jgi:PPOX class probable F420-dependent enzyme
MRERVVGARVARLATVGAEEAPQQVPFCFVLDGDSDTLYSAVDDKPKRTHRLQRLRNVARRPRVSVLVDHYEEDWSRLWWVRLDGRARELEPGDESERAVDLLAGKYPQYRQSRPSGPVLRIDVHRWSCWEATTA